MVFIFISYFLDTSSLVKLARDLTRPGPPNGGLVWEIPLFQGNLGEGEILFHLAMFDMFDF